MTEVLPVMLSGLQGQVITTEEKKEEERPCVT